MAQNYVWLGPGVLHGTVAEKAVVVGPGEKIPDEVIAQMGPQRVAELLDAGKNPDLGPGMKVGTFVDSSELRSEKLTPEEKKMATKIRQDAIDFNQTKLELARANPGLGQGAEALAASARA